MSVAIVAGCCFERQSGAVSVESGSKPVKTKAGHDASGPLRLYRMNCAENER